MPETKVPALPDPNTIQDPHLRRIMAAVKEALDIRLGRRGDKLDRAVTVRELYEGGIVNVSGMPNINLGNNGYGGRPLSPPPFDPAVPPAPTDLQADGAFTNIILTWNNPPVTNLSHIEVWRAGADNLSEANMIGSTGGSVYSDNVGTSGVYYYWVRAVNLLGNPGPYNATTGTRAETAIDVEAALEALAGEISESQLTVHLANRIDLIDGTDEGSVNQRLTEGLANEARKRIDGIRDEQELREADIIRVEQLVQDESESRATDFLGLSSSIGNVNSSVDQLSETVSDLDRTTSQRFTQVNSSLNNISTRSVDNSSAINTLNSSVSNINNTIQAHSGQLTELESTVSLIPGGRGVNMMVTPYSDFEIPPQDLVLWRSSGTTAVIAAEQKQFYDRSLRVSGTNATNVVHLGANSADYNIVITPGKGWILSAYVYTSSTTAVRLRVRRSNGSYTTAVSATVVAGSWQRISGLADLRNTADTSLLVRLESVGAGVVTYFDGIMLEQWYGSASREPSAYVRPSDSRATSQALQSLTTRVTQNEGEIHSVSSNLTTLTTQVGGNTATIQQQATSINGLSAQYSVKIDVAGHVSGYGLMTTGVNDPQSLFGVTANRFFIAPPAIHSSRAPTTTYPGMVWVNGSNVRYRNSANTGWRSSPNYYPFIVQTTPTSSAPAGVYINDAYIRNASIVSAKIADAAIDNAKIANGAITTAKIGDAEITTAKLAGLLQSDNYSSQSGWAIYRNGHAIFNNVYARGTIEGSHIKGSLIEGSLFIGGTVMTLPTQADGGTNSTRHLAFANASWSGGSNGSGTRSVNVSLRSANFTGDGTQNYEGQRVWRNFNRYLVYRPRPRFSISSSGPTIIQTAQGGDGTNSFPGFPNTNWTATIRVRIRRGGSTIARFTETVNANSSNHSSRTFNRFGGTIRLNRFTQSGITQFSRRVGFNLSTTREMRLPSYGSNVSGNGQITFDVRVRWVIDNSGNEADNVNLSAHDSNEYYL